MVYLRTINSSTFSNFLIVSGLPESKRNTIYGGNNTHPSSLTPTERFRVIRACYKIWTLTFENEKSIRIRVDSLRPRELLYFAELFHIARVTNFPGTHTWDTFYLLKAAKRALTKLYHGTYGCMPPKFQDLLHSESPVALFVIWDHWQNNLKNLICKKPVSNLRWDPKGEILQHLWDYESGDELLLAEN
jgi:hypothetical protein